MSQGAIALLIFAPTAINLTPKQDQLLIEPGSFGMIFWQSVPLLFVFGNLLLQFINLSAGACFSAIKTARVEEKRSADLLAMFIDGCGGYVTVHPPNRARHTPHTFPRQPGRPFPPPYVIKH